MKNPHVKRTSPKHEEPLTPLNPKTLTLVEMHDTVFLKYKSSGKEKKYVMNSTLDKITRECLHHHKGEYIEVDGEVCVISNIPKHR